MRGSVHDNVVDAIEVRPFDGTLTIRTRNPYATSDAPDVTEVRFDGVAAYSLKDVLFRTGNILFDIVEEPILDLFAASASDLAEGARYGWPDLLGDSPEQKAESARQLGLRAWEINSSLGMSGWVVAREMFIL